MSSVQDVSVRERLRAAIRDVLSDEQRRVERRMFFGEGEWTGQEAKMRTFKVITVEQIGTSEQIVEAEGYRFRDCGVLAFYVGDPGSLERCEKGRDHRETLALAPGVWRSVAEVTTENTIAELRARVAELEGAPNLTPAK